MKKYVKITALLIIAVLAMTLLAACGDGKPFPETADALYETLQGINNWSYLKRCNDDQIAQVAEKLGLSAEDITDIISTHSHMSKDGCFDDGIVALYLAETVDVKSVYGKIQDASMQEKIGGIFNCKLQANKEIIVGRYKNAVYYGVKDIANKVLEAAAQTD